MTRKKTEYYVNNKEFLAAITDYREKVLLQKKQTNPAQELQTILAVAF